MSQPGPSGSVLPSQSTSSNVQTQTATASPSMPSTFTRSMAPGTLHRIADHVGREPYQGVFSRFRHLNAYYLLSLQEQIIQSQLEHGCCPDNPVKAIPQPTDNADGKQSAPDSTNKPGNSLLAVPPTDAASKTTTVSSTISKYPSEKTLSTIIQYNELLLQNIQLAAHPDLNKHELDSFKSWIELNCRPIRHIPAYQPLPAGPFSDKQSESAADNKLEEGLTLRNRDPHDILSPWLAQRLFGLGMGHSRDGASHPGSSAELLPASSRGTNDPETAPVASPSPPQRAHPPAKFFSHGSMERLSSMLTMFVASVLCAAATVSLTRLRDRPGPQLGVMAALNLVLCAFVCGVSPRWRTELVLLVITNSAMLIALVQPVGS